MIGSTNSDGSVENGSRVAVLWQFSGAEVSIPADWLAFFGHPDRPEPVPDVPVKKCTPEQEFRWSAGGKLRFEAEQAEIKRRTTQPTTLERVGFDGLYKISISIRVRVEPTPHKCNIYLAAKLQMLARKLEYQLEMVNCSWRKLINEEVRRAAGRYMRERSEIPNRRLQRDKVLTVNLPQQIGLLNPEIKV